MKYFLIRTTNGTIEVAASDINQAYQLATQWVTANGGGNVLGADPSENGGGGGNAQPVGAVTTPAVGFSRTPGRGATSGATDASPLREQQKTQNFAMGGRLYDLGGNAGSTGLPAGGSASTKFGPVNTEVQKDFQYESYLQGLKNANRNPYGAFGSYLRERYNPTRAAFRFNELLGGSPSLTGLQGFTEQNAQGTGGDINQQALMQFRNLAGAGTQANSFQPSFTQDLRDRLFNAKTGDDGSGLRGDALQLALAGARSKISPYFASQAYNPDRISDDFGEEMYRNTAGGGDQGVDFVNFLKKRFGF